MIKLIQITMLVSTKCFFRSKQNSHDKIIQITMLVLTKCFVLGQNKIHMMQNNSNHHASLNQMLCFLGQNKIHMIKNNSNHHASLNQMLFSGQNKIHMIKIIQITMLVLTKCFFQVKTKFTR